MNFLTLIGPTGMVVLLGALTGALVNLVKRLPQLPSRWVPLVAMTTGAAIYGVEQLAGGHTVRETGQLVLEAGLTGSFPIALHNLVAPPLRAWLGDAAVDKWLGQADAPDGGGGWPSKLIALLAKAQATTVLIAALLFGTVACLPAASAERVAECAARYQACVAVSQSRAEYQACRAQVDAICLDGAGGTGGGR
jgi:hypothetical protein